MLASSEPEVLHLQRGEGLARDRLRPREESGSQLHESRMKPYHIYFEGNAGLLARDYAKFPNKVLWKLAERVREVALPGRLYVWKIPWEQT